MPRSTLFIHFNQHISLDSRSSLPLLQYYFNEIKCIPVRIVHRQHTRCSTNKYPHCRPTVEFADLVSIACRMNEKPLQMIQYMQGTEQIIHRFAGLFVQGLEQKKNDSKEWLIRVWGIVHAPDKRDSALEINYAFLNNCKNNKNKRNERNAAHCSEVKVPFFR